MIPVTNDDLQQDFEIAVIPSRTFKLHPTTEIVAGYVDELEAVKQAIYLILNIERFEYLIHSWDIGVELADLIGRPISFCLPEIKRRITEALVQDDRITVVENFEFDVNKGKVHATFTVSTIFGTIEAERMVEI